ncbi:MAG TPA: transglycosylase SLT domain-containing protein [Hydrogenophaga sp.]|nr:transglycosylase SLT domain-containing protein [Hydrogenophaga sp.]
MFDCPDLAVPREVMHHVVQVESSRNPFAIGVVGGYLARQPRNLDEALAAVNLLRQEGYNFSVGIAQVNRYNLAPYGLNTYAEAFDVCANLQAGSRILRECYDRAQDWGKAFSCYYSGNFVTGFKHGYVQKIYASMRKVQAGASDRAGLRVIPYNNQPRRLARQENLPLGTAAVAPPVDHIKPYPEPYAVRKYLPHTPLEVSAHAMALANGVTTKPETAESRPAIPVPGPGALMPATDAQPKNSLAHIPVQVVGVNGNPYQTRVIQPVPSTPGEQLPLPDPHAVIDPSIAAGAARPKASVATLKGGSLLHTTESSGKPENPTASIRAGGGAQPQPDPSDVSDRSFVF